MHFGYSIIYVASVLETLAFYDKAFGLQTPPPLQHPRPPYPLSRAHKTGGTGRGRS